MKHLPANPLTLTATAIDITGTVDVFSADLDATLGAGNITDTGGGELISAANTGSTGTGIKKPRSEDRGSQSHSDGYQKRKPTETR